MKKKLTFKNLIFLVISIVFVIALIRQQETSKRIEKDKQTNQVQLQELKETNERLHEENDKAQSDEYLEQLARERLNMIKPGETSLEIKKADPKS
ncbi:FtsB family cell division protein [Clostridium vincentii]|uniref:Cell division protein FtsL n=1 Tax=Clostridium vincentii TaxID=52704 RepID=A0A2T0BHE4_9CLOT|nr:septum formation initiator family protein [Clostridium vincentii]PRR83331.1 Cell division protein FtsL [Clostridium vincentii]